MQISQEAGQVIWCSHLLKNFPEFVVIYTVKGVGVVNKAEVGVFLELFCLFDDPADVDNLISGSSLSYRYKISCCLVATSCLTLVTMQTGVPQAPLSMGFPRQEY